MMLHVIAYCDVRLQVDRITTLAELGADSFTLTPFYFNTPYHFIKF